MKNILTTMTVLALLVGISGCLFPFRDGRGDRRGYWRGDRRDNRYEQRPRDRDDRYERGHGDRSGRDCWSRDGQVYCR
jgi:hypothetical protein